MRIVFRHNAVRGFALTLAIILAAACALRAQVAGTGAIAGTVTDATGAIVPGAEVTLHSQATGEERHTTTAARGEYNFQILPPGRYDLTVTQGSFAPSTFTDVTVNVTEITTINARLTVGKQHQTVNVAGQGQLLETESSALGQVVTSEMVENLPLVSRNYTQIIDLSPGVSAEVGFGGGEIGRGGGSGGSNNSLDAITSAGTSSNDNNFQMDGVDIDDLQGSGSFSGGVAVPNPDTIQEFKVQTSGYDASYGRNAGANVNVVTKTGSNRVHGAVWEFFRNDALNANNYFFNQTGTPRGALKQNQPGFSLGGPISQNKLFYFLSYQSTRQVNGVDGSCSSHLVLPAGLTNDRSAAALGALFAGTPTLWNLLVGPGGSEVAPDGSNIAPQALALFNLKTANGQYVIPTPQTVVGSQGIANLSQNCHFNEDHFMTNGEWRISPKDNLQARFFFVNSEQLLSFPGSDLGGSTLPGFPQTAPNHFRNFSLIENHIFGANLLNQAEVGYHRTYVNTGQQESFNYSGLGSTVPAFDNPQPAINILFGGVSFGGNGQSVELAQNTFIGQDAISWTHGAHALRMGGGFERAQDNIAQFTFLGGLVFGTYADFLLGQSAAQNGTGFSNIYESIDVPGDLTRGFRQNEANAWVQDDYKVARTLTLNLGFRYEYEGGISDNKGRVSTFNLAAANPNPPAGGTLQGYTLASNFPGTVPAGVTKSSNKLATGAVGLNTLNPRVGFSWQLPETHTVLLRAGYGVYHSTPTGQPSLQLLTTPPFGELREIAGGANGGSNWAMPIPAFTSSVPFFPAYSPTTDLGLITFAQNFRPAVYQHYDMNMQFGFTPQSVLEVGFLGTRGTHLTVVNSPNMALPASATNPIRGQTANTLANIPLRVPVEGLDPESFEQFSSIGNSWYNAMLVNYTHRFRDSSQVQLAYTWAKNLTDSAGFSTGPNGGTVLGNQDNLHSNYGPDEYTRPHRFVGSFVYRIPTPFRATSFAGETLGGWRAAGVVTVQAGHWLYITSTNATNAFGINHPESDFAELSPACTQSQVETPGSVTSKLSHYFNTGCFTAYPVIGADGVATGFGNTRPGIARGPGQENADLSLIKNFTFPLQNHEIATEFRVEAFNALNTPQFQDPNTYSDTAVFGTITALSVSPRILQLALKLSF